MRTNTFTREVFGVDEFGYVRPSPSDTQGWVIFSNRDPIDFDQHDGVHSLHKSNAVSCYYVAAVPKDIHLREHLSVLYSPQPFWFKLDMPSSSVSTVTTYSLTLNAPPCCKSCTLR